MKRVLLTGAGGFVGARAAEQLSGQLELIPVPRGWMQNASQPDIARLIEDMHPDAVLHLAALADTGFCEKNPDASYRANVLVPLWIAQAARGAGAKLVAFSSDQVYAGCGRDGALSEDVPLSPSNVYGRHKLEAEQKVLDAAPDAVLLRATWMYDLPGYRLPMRAGFLVQLFRAALRGERLMFSDRDFRGVTYVRQAVSNLVPALELPGGVYNYGSENDCGMLETARRFCAELGISPALIPGDRERNLLMDTAKARRGGVVFDTTCGGVVRCLEDYGLRG